jgi:hypothetical protein
VLRLGLAPAPLEEDEDVVLDVRGVGVAEDDVAEPRPLDSGQVLRLEPLVLVPEPVAVAQALELPGDDGREGGPDEGPRREVLGQPAGPQVDLVDGPERRPQGVGGGRVAGDLVELRIRLQPQRSAGLVERAQAQVPAALDVDRGEVQAHGGVEQEVAQILDDARVHRLRQVGGEVAQEAAAPPSSANSAGGRKKASRSSSSGPVTSPASSFRSVSAETVECPQR